MKEKDSEERQRKETGSCWIKGRLKPLFIQEAQQLLEEEEELEEVLALHQMLHNIYPPPTSMVSLRSLCDANKKKPADVTWLPHRLSTTRLESRAS